MNNMSSTRNHVGHGRTLLGTIGAWTDRVFQRRALESLNHRMLSDFGISPSDRDLECHKAFWQG